jgi:hypothetical protein
MQKSRQQAAGSSANSLSTAASDDAGLRFRHGGAQEKRSCYGGDVREDVAVVVVVPIRTAVGQVFHPDVGASWNAGKSPAVAGGMSVVVARVAVRDRIERVRRESPPGGSFSRGGLYAALSLSLTFTSSRLMRNDLRKRRSCEVIFNSAGALLVVVLLPFTSSGLRLC